MVLAGKALILSSLVSLIVATMGAVLSVFSPQAIAGLLVFGILAGTAGYMMASD
jgi:hypothetical protein